MGRRGAITELRDLARAWRWGRRPLPPADVAHTAAAPPTWEFPTGWSRTRPAAVARRGLQGGVLHPLLRSQLRITVEGREIAEEATRHGAVIFAPNHTSHLDAPLVLTALTPTVRRDTITVAASDYFFDAWWRATVTALVFNAVPIDRGVGERRELPTDLIADGNHLLIFPEGTRSKDGYSQRFRHGVAGLASETGAPIIPVAIEGSWRAMPRGRSWPAKGRPSVRVSFGAALRPDPDERVGELTRRLEASIAALVDEHRTDWWSAMRRAQQGESPTLRGPDVADWRRRWALLEDDDAPTRRKVWARKRAS